jgi:hypothetical protein
MKTFNWDDYSEEEIKELQDEFDQWRKDNP